MSRFRRNFVASCLLVWLCTFASFGQSRRNLPGRPLPPPRPVSSDPKQTVISVDAIGGFEGLVYTNPGLRFSLTLPKTWQPQDVAAQEQFAKFVGEKAGESTEVQQSMQGSIGRTRILFIAVKPTNARSNAIAMGMAEDITLNFNVRTPRQYLESMQRIKLDSLPLVFDDIIGTEQIAGVEFGVLGAGPKPQSSSASPTARQRYYVTIRKNHAVVFILTYHGDEELRACIELLNGLRFN